MLIDLSRGSTAFSRITFGRSVTDQMFVSEIASALVYICSNRLGELFSFKMTSELLSKVIVSISAAQFRSLAPEIVKQLFFSEHEQARKAAALKSIQVFPKNKLAQFLKEYVESTEKHYYNVVHWLDFGVSVPKERSLKVAERIVRSTWSK